ncbi:thioesterase II family protein [Kitasatospora mediocidica]|uniref:thioesterase II family protein n=1 Tax=Kitasatospora mediocidica TaxID=58352 RepID=UPI00055E3635|nr:alpha/beta fold hydrolase [Kitasatospora mediocidica]
MSVRTAPVAGRWFQAESEPDAPVRLFLFHYAGSGSSIYRDWPPLLPADISTQCVQLPGRQDRHSETAFTEVEPLIETLAEEITDELDDRPYAFFGHCMGALLAYRLTVAVRERGGPAPVLLGTSAWAPVGFRTPPVEQLDVPEAEIVEWARGLGSLPEEILNDREMLELMLPAMRADLAVCASYQDDSAAVPCPIVSYSATRDPLVAPEAMSSWATRSPDYLGNRLFQGGHFFVHDETLPITADFVRLLRRQVTETAR